MNKGLFFLPLVLALVACSNDESSDADTPTDDNPTTVQELENSGAIPKLARGSDLEGADVDNNGIRDDVDDYISNHFSESSHISAANQAARANQAVLNTDLLSPTAVRQTNQKISRATACIYEVFEVPGSGSEPAEVSRDLEAITFNTASRLKKYMEFNKALDGASWSLPEGSSCE
ncbi:hypothetical protein [Marinobacter orientalis]|uniref:Lipoprotein n=1 Tax=Marinobacter orientalis TaxID=1928859 RepID=A0A7Y0RDS7_9GAMM|nr:hypothetical protein [Marinobacter orientalis]NMT64364.1 hypothetical protein [Marinobacter orientalis]TGX50667.1 hypothetical protein DIT72_01060 [Marinobacter orientalis]